MKDEGLENLAINRSFLLLILIIPASHLPLQPLPTVNREWNAIAMTEF